MLADYKHLIYCFSVITVNSSSFEAQFIIQGLTKGHGKKSGDPHAIPAGLTCDPKSRSLVLNGRPGHIQFYSLQEDKQLYNVSKSRDSTQLCKDNYCITK